MAAVLTRTLVIDDTGLDVEACRRALIRFLKTGTLDTFTAKPDTQRRRFDATAVAQTMEAQKQLRIPVDGELGPRTYTALRDKGAFDKLADQLLAEYADQVDEAAHARAAVDKLRADVVSIGLALHNRRARIAYSQSRPTQLRPVLLTTRLDCSGLVARCMWGAGLKLPGVNWAYTNTWSQIKLGRPVTRLADVLPGDVVFYGTSPSNPTHEALAVGGGRVLTNGHYPMSIETIDYRRDRVGIRRFI